MQEVLSSLNWPEWLKRRDRRIFFLKTCLGSFRMTEAGRLASSSPRFMTWGIMSNGLCLTANILESLNQDGGCSLSDILGQTIQKLEFAAAAYKRNNRAASQLSQSIAELNAKLLALERLRSKGYLAADIYHTQAREIRQQLGKLKTERYSSFESRITTMLEDVRKLKSLIDELEQPLEVFDEKLFHEIVTDICINNRDEMTVTLLGGLKFIEQI